MERPRASVARERKWLVAAGLLLVVLALVVTFREYSLHMTSAEWDARQSAVNDEQSRLLARRLEALCLELHAAAIAMRDAQHPSASDATRREAVAQVRRAGFSFEYIDAAGAVHDYDGEPIRLLGGRAHRSPYAIEQRTPFHLLVASVPMAETSPGGGTIAVAAPFAPSVPLNQRFLRDEGFLPTLSRELDLELSYNAMRPAPRSGTRVLPFTMHGDTLGFIGVEEIGLETRLDQLARRFDRVWLPLLLAAMIFLTVPLFRLLGGLPPAIATTLMVLHVIAVRFVLRFSGFAERVFPDALSDPAHFASGFGWGLTDSPGELTLTAGALLWAAFAVHRMSVTVGAREDVGARGAADARPTVRTILLLLAVFSLLPFLLRAFAACIRSFVVDSAFNFDSIDGLLSSPMLLLMVGNSYLLSLSLGFFLIALTLALRRSLARVNHPIARTLVLLAAATAGVLLIRLTTADLLLPLWAYVLFVLVFVLPLLPWVPSLRGRAASLVAPLFVATALGAVLVVPLFGRSMETKRSSEIEAIALDVARPIDGWSQVLMEQTLQYVARVRIDTDQRASSSPADEYTAAFRVWAGSPLSRLQNNSAILLTDSAGLPFSRFAVGSDPFLLSMHAISTAVARTEGIVQRMDRQLETRARRYYQGYADILTARDRGLVGVVILEALNPMDMEGSGVDLLRSAPATLGSAPEDRFIISRFRGSRLVQTTERGMERTMPLPSAVTAAFAAGQESVWHTLPVDGAPLRTYFMRLPEPDHDVLAITRGKSEPLLTAYRALRIVVLFAFFSALIWVGVALASGRFRHWSRLTFARRLQLALLGIAAIPLLLIWMTGRNFALETTLTEIERQVSEDLDALRSNLLEQVPDSLPLHALRTTLTDQRCQEIRLRSGRDLNVYHRTELIATSKPELYHVGLLNNRLHPEAWRNIVLRGRDAWFNTERIGDFSYQVGYRAIRDADGALAVVISTPTLFQREQIDRGYVTASATIFLWIVAIAVLVFFISEALARQISRPLHELLRATRDITAGNLERRVHVSGAAEIVDLMDAFNTMTTRLRRSQEELAAAERELAWKEMAKQVAHEIRNPLTPMKLAVQHLHRAWKDGAQQIGAIVETVTRTLIDQIDSLSRISDEFSRFGRMPRRSTARIDVAETLRESVALFGAHEELRFSLRIDDPLPPVLADREELGRAVTNLLRNAVQATHEGGHIAVTATAPADGIRIRISDTGSGIAPALLTRIFEPNFSTRTEGMGLGLAIVKKIIDDAGGTISIQSTPGVGTTVDILLPAAADDPTM
ncbi:MAG: ATP-binding protein [Bacteroidota bacterium]|jgi:signal transduction histidine kinase|nr:ATP-binding protein [Bacteroidota bacterium]